MSDRSDTATAINPDSRRGRKRTQRERILDAMVRVASRDGNARGTVSAVIALAGVSRPTFYDYFADRDACFLAALADSRSQLNAAVRDSVERRAPEYAREAAIEAVVEFAASRRAMARLLMSEAMAGGPKGLDTQLLERNPLIAHIGFVEAYAVGRSAAQRVEDSHIAFTMFLQDGHRYLPESERPSRVALEAIITTIFETIYREARAGASTHISMVLPDIAHLWLTPFMGSMSANESIDRMLTHG